MVSMKSAWVGQAGRRRGDEVGGGHAAASFYFETLPSAGLTLPWRFRGLKVLSVRSPQQPFLLLAPEA